MSFCVSCCFAFHVVLRLVSFCVSCRVVYHIVLCLISFCLIVVCRVVLRLVLFCVSCRFVSRLILYILSYCVSCRLSHIVCHVVSVRRRLQGQAVAGRATPHESNRRENGESATFSISWFTAGISVCVCVQAYLLIEDDIQDLSRSDEYR